MLSNEDKNILCNALTFWGKLQPNEQNLILNNTMNVTFNQGENIHGGVSHCTGLLIIKSGRLRAYILSEEGKEVTLYFLGEGDVCILSASCIINNITFDVHIDAEIYSKVILVSIDIVNRISDNVYVENFILNEAVVRFSDVMWALEQILFFKFDQRLAMLLLDEISRNNSEIITLTHEQIAGHLGSAREVVTRMLRYFSREGFVELSRGVVRIIDKNALRKIVSFKN